MERSAYKMTGRCAYIGLCPDACGDQDLTALMGLGVASGEIIVLARRSLMSWLAMTLGLAALKGSPLLYGHDPPSSWHGRMWDHCSRLEFQPRQSRIRLSLLLRL